MLDENDLHDDGRDRNWEERSARSSGDGEPTAIELLELLPEKLESSAQQACSDWEGNRGGIVGDVGERKGRGSVLLKWYQLSCRFHYGRTGDVCVVLGWGAPKHWKILGVSHAIIE